MDEVYDVGEFVQKIVEHTEPGEVLEIYFGDLNEETQEQVLKYFNIHEPEEMNWDVAPIAILERPEQEE